jgi:hypothetical protein
MLPDECTGSANIAELMRISSPEFSGAREAKLLPLIPPYPQLWQPYIMPVIMIFELINKTVPQAWLEGHMCHRRRCLRKA